MLSLHTGTIISLNDSTVSNIDFKKKKYSVKMFDDILKGKEDKENQNDNENQDESIDEEYNQFIISETPGTYQNSLEDSSALIKTLMKPKDSAFIIYPSVIKSEIKNEISEFQNSWENMSIDLTEYGIDKDSIIIKMATESDDGNFNFDLISFQKFLGYDEELKVPDDFKKVRKI